MKSFYRLKKENKKNYSIVFKTEYVICGSINKDIVEKVFEFAYGMSFGRMGEHRPNRSGGKEKRHMGQIFTDAFQGKLGEFAFYLEMKDNHNINLPDLQMYGRNKWDIYDFKVDDKFVAIKTTKHFGQLLLLESKDWNSNGEYIPNSNEKYDCVFMIRIKESVEDIMKKNSFLYLDSIDKETLKSIIMDSSFTYDTPRYITLQELVYLIQNNYCIKQGDILNGKTSLDANNYYCHIKDMHIIKKYIQ